MIRRALVARRGARRLPLLAVLVLSQGAAHAQPPPEPEIRLFFEAASQDEDVAKSALEELGNAWRDGYAPLLVDLARFLKAPREVTLKDRPDVTDEDFADPDESVTDIGSGSLGGAGLDSLRAPRRRRVESPGAKARDRIVKFLEKQTGQRFGHDLDAWHRWLWSHPYDPHGDYAVFKAALYGQVDQNMVPFFMAQTQPQIRLDQVEWGGVLVNGIPPLDQPATLPAAEADYLADSDVVFGVVAGGEARAYPQRILAWHELARDTLGGRPLAVVYCTLCGTVIPYVSEVGGRKFTLGTSGLLYRSNKLMFDAETQSLWSTVEGRPVVGALAGQKIELPALPVVRTTWGEWKGLHPETSVLALETGYERDYGEGAAYKDYFASPEPMFAVPAMDDRLKPKDRVMTLLLRPAGQRDATREAMALSSDFLAKHAVHHFELAGQQLVALTSPGGATRVYAAGTIRFDRLAGPGQVVDDAGQPWTVTEDALLPDGRDQPACRRVAARPAFWFGWYAAFPDTALVN